MTTISGGGYDRLPKRRSQAKECAGLRLGSGLACIHGRQTNVVCWFNGCSWYLSLTRVATQGSCCRPKGGLWKGEDWGYLVHPHIFVWAVFRAIKVGTALDDFCEDLPARPGRVRIRVPLPSCLTPSFFSVVYLLSVMRGPPRRAWDEEGETRLEGHRDPFAASLAMLPELLPNHQTRGLY